MKNKILYILITLILSVSCENVLDIQNENAYDASVFFTDKSTALESCNATYAALLTQGGWTWEILRTFDLLGYDAVKNFPLLARFQAIGDYTYDPTNSSVSVIFGNFYRLIFRANFSLDLMEKLEVTDPGELALIDRYIGEVEFLKSLGYYYLVSAWGDVPLKATLSDHYITQQARTPSAEIWAHIETSLLDAIDRLPVSYDAANYGRATKGAAMALLGKVYLAQGRYTDAIAQLMPLTSPPFDYELAESLDDIFIYDEITKETIFPVIHNTWQGPGVAEGRVSSRGTEENPGNYASTGRPRDYSFLEWWNTLLSGAVIESFNYLDEGGNPYHDPRAALTFYDSFDENGEWMGGDTTWCDECEGGPRSYPDHAAIGRGNAIYSWRKIEILEFSDYNSGQPAGDIDSQVLRYADVLLMLAECDIEKASPDLEAARLLINEVRARSGAFEFTTLGTQAEARAKLRRERTMEFPGEAIRWFDLARWGVIVAQINAEKTVYENSSPLKSYHNKLPIPQIEKDANPILNEQVLNGWN